MDSRIKDLQSKIYTFKSIESNLKEINKYYTLNKHLIHIKYLQDKIKNYENEIKKIEEEKNGWINIRKFFLRKRELSRSDILTIICNNRKIDNTFYKKKIFDKIIEE